MRRLSAIVVPTILVLVFSNSTAVYAQVQSTPACTSVSDAGTAPLQVSLPIPVLDHLARISNSVFVHAFLIRVIADTAAGENRLSSCARKFTMPQAQSLAVLRSNYPDATSIINALRDAEARRIRLEEFASTGKQLTDVLDNIYADTTLGIEISINRLRLFAKADCAPAALCKMIQTIVDAGDALLSARREIAPAAEAARRTSDALAKLTGIIATTRAAIEADTTGAVAAVTDAAAAGRLTILKKAAQDLDSARIVASRIERDSAANLVRLVEQASQRRIELRKAIGDARSASDGTIRQLSVVAASQLAQLGAKTARLTGVGEGSNTPASNPSARSDNVVIAVADFVIARAKREAINTFIINLHLIAQKDPLIQNLFPESWALMRNIPKRNATTLNAQDVGRIPLTAWRATLATDFVALPVTVLTTAPAVLCPTPALPKSRDSAAVPIRADLSPVERVERCTTRLTTLQPIGLATKRLLQGDGALDVLADHDLFRAADTVLTPLMRRFSQGLSTIGYLAETFAVQGHLHDANAAAHPYVLSVRSWLHVPESQRAATVRLLWLNSLTALDSLPSLSSGYRVVGTAVRALEQIASAADTADSRGVRAAMVIRNVFETYTSAAEFAKTYVTADRRVSTLALSLDTLEMRTRMIAGVIEPLMSREFGLAFSRSTNLVTELVDGERHPRFITFLGLASSLSQAGNGEETRAALEAAATPAGGWQGKRYREGAASITAFPGIAIGHEWLLDEGGEAATVRNGLTGGISLPIGFEWQLLKTHQSLDTVAQCPFLQICSLNAFVGLVDLGAVLSYRITGRDSVITTPNATWSKVFAPGLYLSFPITQTVPLTIVTGAQLMPSLRSVSLKGGTATGERSSIRWSIQAAMDITLFRFQH